MGELLTPDRLARAIQKRVGGGEMVYESARNLAEHVLNFFGYYDRIIDNFLNSGDRDLFYMLEDAGLLTTEREEIVLYDGRDWRIHYWRLHEDFIKQEQTKNDAVEEEPNTSIYDEIPDYIWRRDATSEGADFYSEGVEVAA